MIIRMYKCGIYLRTSKNNKDINNSIEMQEKLKKRYIESKQDITVKEIYVDNGYSGLDFCRPGFIKLMNDVDKKEINCIVVKDLSRLGRDYIQTGIYIQNILPNKEVRLIAVNDRYDSMFASEIDNYFMIPLRNYINDLYSKDISMKVRSSLYMKMRKGECAICKVPYGYKKQDGKIIIDDEVKINIQEIYDRYLQGYSIQNIANYLNERDILTPYEYRNNNEKFITSFVNRNKDKHIWYPMMVKRILTDKMYIGTLVQGKVERVSYKIKKRNYKDELKWYYKADNHEKIIEDKLYYIVRRLLRYDIRRKKGEKICDELSGISVCGSCGRGLYYRNNKYQCMRCSCGGRQEVIITKQIVLLLINVLENAEKNMKNIGNKNNTNEKASLRKSVVCNIENIVINNENNMEIIIYNE